MSFKIAFNVITFNVMNLDMYVHVTRINVKLCVNPIFMCVL